MTVKFKVGDEVIYQITFGRTIKTGMRTIRKVGRKYAYLNGGEWWIEKKAFDLDTGIESGRDNYPDRIWVPAEYEAHLHRIDVRKALSDHGIRFEGYGEPKFSTATLEKLLAVLNEDES